MRPNLAFSIPFVARLTTRNAAEIGVDDGVEVVLGHAEQEHVTGDPRVRDDDLDRAELLLDLGECGIQRGHIRDIGPHRQAARRALPGAGGDGDTMSRRHELFGDREADAAVAAGDQYGAGGAHGPPHYPEQANSRLRA